MILDRETVSAAELAFIADVSDREVNRLVDERILPDFLFQIDNGRRFDLSAAALARFYFESQGVLTAETRKSVIEEIAARIKAVPCWSLVAQCSRHSAHRTKADRIDLHVERQYVSIAMDQFFSAACDRATDAVRAGRTIVSAPDILGGEPVFSGSRVPIDTVLGALDEGMSFEELQASWSFLTPSLIDDARLYVKLHRRRGRPRGPVGETKGWKLASRKVIRPEADNE
jgi:uncharacterized protein (DUF433 family)